MPEASKNLPNPADRRFRRAGEAPIRIMTPGRTRLNVTDARRGSYADCILRPTNSLYRRCWLMASRFGAPPNVREYSRLNCDTLS